MLPRDRLELLLIALAPDLQEALGAFWSRLGQQPALLFPTIEAALGQGDFTSGVRRCIVLGQATPTGVRRLRTYIPSESLLAQLEHDAPAELRSTMERAGATEVLPASFSLEEWYTRLESLVPSNDVSDRPSQLIAVCGVTGGCGATTLALEMARELAQFHPVARGKVMLIEIPTRLGALGTLLNLDTTLTSHDLLRAEGRLQRELLEKALVPIETNLEVLIGPFRELPPSPPTAQALRQLLSLAQRRSGIVVLDLPCSFDDVLFETLALAQQSVLVGVQSVSSLRALKLVRDVMVREEGTRPPTVVLNRYDPSLAGFEAQRLEELLGIQPLLTVPSDLPALMASVGENQPLHVVAPHSGLRRGVRAIVLPLRGGTGLTPTIPTMDIRLRPSGPRPLRILHIEDDPFQQQVVRLHLTSLPAYETTILAVVNEQEALQAFRSQPFDVVLLDYHLTEGNGLACLRRLREVDALIPILVISGLTEPHVAAELLEGGADDFLSKENLVGDRLGRTLAALLARSDGLKARLPLREQGGQLSPDQLDLLRYLQRLRDALQDQHFAVGRVQRAVDRLLFELQGDESDHLPRKELLEFFLRLLARSDDPSATEQNGQ